MRRRILFSILAVVILTTAVLGLPLMYTAWLWVDENVRHDMQVRLGRIAAEVRSQEAAGAAVQIDTEDVRSLIPDRAQLEVEYPGDAGLRREVVGVADVHAPIVETFSMGPAGTLRMSLDSRDMRTVQARAVAGVALIELASMAAGTAVAVITAQRLADPLRDVAARAARLGMGDFRRDPKRHAVPELDRVSEVLDAAAGGSSANTPWSRTCRISCAAGSRRFGCGWTSCRCTPTRQSCPRPKRRWPRWIGSPTPSTSSSAPPVPTPRRARRPSR
jgi:hypothetical protein